MAPRAAAGAPRLRRKPGRAAVAISWPVSDRRLPSPMPTTPRLRSTGPGAADPARAGGSGPRAVIGTASHHPDPVAAGRPGLLRTGIVRRADESHGHGTGVPVAPPALAAAGPAGLVGQRVGGSSRRRAADRPPRHRPAARPRLPGRRD